MVEEESGLKIRRTNWFIKGYLERHDFDVWSAFNSDMGWIGTLEGKFLQLSMMKIHTEKYLASVYSTTEGEASLHGLSGNATE